MKILCSGELYDKPIETKECLDCALKMAGRQPCGYGYRLLKSMFAGQEDRSGEIHVTDITGCLLKAYLGKTSPEPKYVHDELVLWIGRAVHDALDLSDAFVTSEIPVEGHGVVGRLDAEYEDHRIEDAKTTRWLKPSNVPYGSHELQVNIYKALRNNGGDRLQLQMIDMSGPTRCRSCKIPFRMIDGVVQCPQCGKTYDDAHLGAMLIEVPVTDPEEIEAYIKERVEVLSNSLKSEIPPPAEPSFLCNYCSHVSCPYNQNKE